MDYNLKNPTLILFYADWCGHCQTFMPIWDEFKTKINKEEYNIIKIESANPFTKKIQVVQGYPTIFYIDGDDIKEYNKGRDVKSLVNFLKENKN
jgi:thiol-disulfide isomerase/thioredoxin